MHIRVADPEDGPDIAKIYAPIVEKTYISFEEVPPAAREMSLRIEKTLKTHPWLVADDGGTIVAYAYAGSHRSRPAYNWSCDVSVYVGENTRRSGVATLLYSSLLSALIKQGFANAFAGIALPNEASVGFHEKMGFSLIGVYPHVGFKKGTWRDVGWWSRPLQVFDEDPPQPLEFGAHREVFTG